MYACMHVFHDWKTLKSQWKIKPNGKWYVKNKRFEITDIAGAYDLKQQEWL